MKTIVLTRAAAHDLDVLPGKARGNVLDALHDYAVTGRGNVKRLSGQDGYRMRVGSYRVIFDEDASTILAIYVGRRSTTIYRR